MKRRNSTGSAGSKSSADSSSNGNAAHNKNSSSSSRRSAKHQTKRIKFESKKSGSAASRQPEFAKLDPSNPEHARRIQQRRKTIGFGKNTLGYEEYIKQVPKEKRRMRSMKTPMTPDATLDIPTSRWTGMVRAWRRALHDYDPKDFQKDLDAAADDSMAIDEPSLAKSPAAEGKTVQDQEISAAESKGLLVDTKNQEKKDSPVSVIPTSIKGDILSSPAPEMKELDQWEQKQRDNLVWADIDSDDDLI